MTGSCLPIRRRRSCRALQSGLTLCCGETGVVARRPPVRTTAICVRLCSSVFPQSRAFSAARNGHRRSNRDAARLLHLRHKGKHRCTQMHTDRFCSADPVRAHRPIGRNRSWPRNAGRVTDPDRWYYPPDSQSNRDGLKRLRPANAGVETAENTTRPPTGGRQPPQPFSVALRGPRSSSVLKFFSRFREEGRQPDAHPECRTLPARRSPNRRSAFQAPLTGLPASTQK
jgi:hypothetical protein